MSLLERSDALAQLEAALDRARAGPEGRLVMVGGEAGIGKTSLVRAFCGEPTAVLWGNCDPLFTPRPLGPIIEIAERLGGDLPALVDGEAPPHRVAAALLRRARDRRAGDRRARGRPLGGRGDARRAAAARAPRRDRRLRCRLHVPRRRARRASTRCASCSASSPRPEPSSG